MLWAKQLSFFLRPAERLVPRCERPLAATPYFKRIYNRLRHLCGIAPRNVKNRMQSPEGVSGISTDVNTNRAVLAATRTRQIPDCRATMGHRPASRNLVGAFAFLSEMIEGAAHFHWAVWCLLLPCTLALDLQAF
jgi:hypothetical protein